MYQKIVIIGNLGRDPEMRYLDSGKAVTNFNVAVNNKYKDNDETIWFRVSAWGKQAESANQYLKSGSKVLVEGKLTADKETGNPRVFQKKDGAYSATFEIMADRVVFMDSKKTSDTVSEKQDDLFSENESPF